MCNFADFGMPLSLYNVPDIVTFLFIIFTSTRNPKIILL